MAHGGKDCHQGLSVSRQEHEQVEAQIPIQGGGNKKADCEEEFDNDTTRLQVLYIVHEQIQQPYKCTQHRKELTAKHRHCPAALHIM